MTRPVPWTKFQRMVHPKQELSEKNIRIAMTMLHCDYETARLQILYQLSEMDDHELWGNSRYIVSIHRRDTFSQLSIKRVDKTIARDWRDLQRIKNELMGPEYEAVEIFPAESRRVDTADQTFLWVLPAGKHVPTGFTGRHVHNFGPEGGSQRPLDPDDPTWQYGEVKT